MQQSIKKCLKMNAFGKVLSCKMDQWLSQIFADVPLMVKGALQTADAVPLFWSFKYVDQIDLTAEVVLEVADMMSLCI